MARTSRVTSMRAQTPVALWTSGFISDGKERTKPPRHDCAEYESLEQAVTSGMGSATPRQTTSSAHWRSICSTGYVKACHRPATEYPLEHLPVVGDGAKAAWD